MIYKLKTTGFKEQNKKKKAWPKPKKEINIDRLESDNMKKCS
jgi:hypothetical protein